jgi:hypothetical protein
MDRLFFREILENLDLQLFYKFMQDFNILCMELLK